MKVLIFGVGAVGSLLAVKLALSGEEVWLVDKGPRLEQLRKSGLQLQMSDGSIHSFNKPNILDEEYHSNKDFDLIILAVKAHQIESIAPTLSKLYGPETAIVTIQNGIPWWYFQRSEGEFADHQLKSCDPNGIIRRYIPAEKIIGCVAYPAVAMSAEGVVQHIEGSRFTLGELDGKTTDRANLIIETLKKAGFKSYYTDDIRSELWLKAWGALSFNPISALTGRTISEIAKNPATKSLVYSMMSEAQDIANKLGITFRHTIERRTEAAAESAGDHKTSMLMDFESGRRMEVDALMGSIIELGELTQTPCDSIKSIWACVELLNESMPKSVTN